MRKPSVDRYYPHTMTLPAVTAAQVVATLEALDEQYKKLPPLAQAVLCEGTLQLIREAALCGSHDGTALFTLETVNSRVKIGKGGAKHIVEVTTRVRPALNALADVRVRVDDEGVDSHTVASVGWVGRVSFYRQAEETYLFGLVFTSEMRALLSWAARLGSKQEDLPEWLRWTW